MGAFLRSGAYVALFQLGIGILGGYRRAMEEAEEARRVLRDPTRHMDEESRVLYHSLVQFRSRDDWDGYNRWLDRHVSGDVPVAQRLAVWESLGRLS